MKDTALINDKANKIIKAILFCVVFTGLFIAFSFLKSFIPETFERIAHGVIGTFVALLCTYLFLRYDKKTFSEIGLLFESTTVRKFILGCCTGCMLMGLLTFSIILYSDFKIELNTHSNMGQFLLWTLPLIPLAFMEEVAFRGYPLSILKESVGIRNSILISSILFASYHIANGWTIQTAFLGAGSWGIIYGLLAIGSKGISMSTGMHYAANLTTSAFGISNDSYHLWVLKQANGTSLENYQSSTWATLIPQLSILIAGIFCMEWYLRRRLPIQ
ncbi:MAG TPA: type II CAAX endopeptidase family protein [Saprospiraceae bacterium]|nr:type II CAAX endopeptidase family protein [Saprospiraceae bacterium]